MYEITFKEKDGYNWERWRWITKHDSDIFFSDVSIET